MTELIVVEKIAEWQRLKALVLDSVSSPITRRVYPAVPFHHRLKQRSYAATAVGTPGTQDTAHAACLGR
jgi:hypothetical protein